MPILPAAIRAARHGAKDLPLVRVDTYGAELRDASGQGFLGDRASNRAFIAILEDWRERVRRGCGEDPFGDQRPSGEIDRQELDRVLQAAEADPEAAGLVQSAIEDFAQEMAGVVRRLLRLPQWKGTERIALGGGFLGSRVGRLAVGRVGILLKAGGERVQMSPVSRHPDDAALCGTVHLAPPELLRQCDVVLAADIGGTNIRAGLVSLGQREEGLLSQANVLFSELWRHADEKPEREEAVDRLASMLSKLARRADEKGMRLCNVIGVGCPGLIRDDGVIERGGQNLPGGGWEDASFNFPARLATVLTKSGQSEPLVILHNDAVVQGLSETSAMQDIEHWAVLTIGTGLGNARFTNQR
ncbi:ROK family protein [Roseicella frigidaeris]|uniref:ROK family protein n=2 Tax=Roseicella frigidaeris TaxID=2230885 RepID=A0A327LXF5_9PROT|nr:ROK family protein [Roseicella frigidaeris]